MENKVEKSVSNENDSNSDSEGDSELKMDNDMNYIEEFTFEDGFKCYKEYIKGKLFSEKWYQNGIMQSRNGQPAWIYHSEACCYADFVYKCWYEKGKLQDPSGNLPAGKYYDIECNGVKKCSGYMWYTNGEWDHVKNNVYHPHQREGSNENDILEEEWREKVSLPGVIIRYVKRN